MGARELRIGSPVLGYQVEALVGRGGMGVVYRVFDPALHRHVALKLTVPELALDETFRERFLQESRAVAALEHPNVVPVYSAGQLEDTLYLAMRYVEGSDLRRLLVNGPLPLERAIGICSDVAAALDAAHERGLVHRDVKPSNILVEDGDRVYLSDFGLSRRLDADLPVPGTSLGTIAYVAPEQIRGEQIDGRADCYSLACVLFECLTGEPPFAGRSNAALLFAHLETAPPEYPGLDRVLATALAKDPADRYPTCGAMVEAARQSLGLGARHSRRWPLIALAAATVVAALAGVAFATHRSSGSTVDPGGRLVAIDARSRSVGHEIRIGGGPDGVAVRKGEVWVTTGDAGDAGLWKADVGSDHAVRFATNGRPTGVALASGDVWVGDGSSDRNGVERFAIDGSLIGSVHTRGDPPFVASGAGLWASGPDDIYRIRPSSGPEAVGRLVTTLKHPGPVNEVRTRWSVNGLAAGREGVWLVGDASDQRLWRVDRGTAGLRTVSLGFPPSSVAVGAGSVWVTDQLGDRLVRVDPVTGRLTSIPVGGEPMAVTVGPSGVWVANAIGGTVWRVDPRSNKVVARIPVGFSPTRLIAAGDTVWVAGNAN